MSIPGAYTSSDREADSDEDFTYSRAMADQAIVDALIGDGETEDSDEDDDYIPGDARQLWEDDQDDSDDDELDEDLEGGDVIIEEEEIEEEVEGEEGGGDGEEDSPFGGATQIGYDPSTRTIVLIDASGNATRLTSAHLRGSGYSMAGLRALLAGATRRRAGLAHDDDDDEDDEEDDSDVDDGSYWGTTKRNAKKWYPERTEPAIEGLELLRGGDFGPPPRKLRATGRKFGRQSSNMADILADRSEDFRRVPRVSLGETSVPGSSGVTVVESQSKVYSGSYSADGNFFYTASQALEVRIYDTSKAPATGDKSVHDSSGLRRGRLTDYWNHRSSLKMARVVKAQEQNCSWTLTDCQLSPKNDWMVYASITPRIGLVKMGTGGSLESEEDQEVLDFARGSRHGGFGIWSVRFNSDASEVVAGATGGSLFVYDIESRRTVLRVEGHSDDVNAVCFADESNSNVLLSGSDDSYVRVWDRRSLSGQRPSGTLVGHTEGITFISTAGDGRYCLSNGKDQGVKLWDLRKMTSPEEFDRKRIDRIDYSIPGWDYRRNTYARPRYQTHPHDNSVMTYRGHSVLRTLIRCGFSPAATTNQQYIYSGSSDGRIHIWNLDGTVAQVLDRQNTYPLKSRDTGDFLDPSDTQLRQAPGPTTSRYAPTVRDVAWHPYEPIIMSTAWETRGGVEGSVAQHEWAPRGGVAAVESERERVNRELFD